MQKLSVKLKNTPVNTSLVHCSVSSVLNKDQTLSVQNIVLAINISEENHSQHRGSSDLRVQNIVYVLNMRGEPLMPTTQQKANKLLRKEKVKVITTKPFTIQLNYPTGENKQPITLGVDAGYSKIGFSAITNTKELISGEVQLRNDVSKKLSERRMYRRTRRNRLWYRKPRFDNRRRKDGWLPPSIEHKLNTHIKLVEKIKEILPITKIIVEVANFDIQKIKNPDIQGKDYQQGEQFGFYNIREYVLHRDNHICQHCKGKSKDKILQVHHIRGKKEGVTDRPEELITVCKTCHEKHNKAVITIAVKPIKTFKLETFMSMVRLKLANQLKEQCDTVSHTYGYITKYNRAKLGLEKSHINDAFVVARGTTQVRSIPFVVTQTKRNNRCLQLNRKGFKPSIRIYRYKFQPNDMVNFKGEDCKVKGVFNYGQWVRLSDYSGNILNSNINNITLITYGKGLEFKCPIHLPPNSNDFGRSLLG